jgi:uncharacterized protein (TIGR03663 family)
MSELPSKFMTWRAVVLGWAVLVVAAAGWLRFADLDSMPVHADEAATGAQTLAYRLEGNYAFDPKHHHGPMLTALAAPWSRVAGETSWEALRIGTMRGMVATCGWLTVVGVLLLGMGWVRSAIAMGLAATSPLLVYYSRVFIHEPVFLLFAMVAMAGLLWLMRRRRPWIAAVVFGLGIGGMAATRETVIISLIVWDFAAALFLWRELPRKGMGEFAEELFKELWKPVLLAAVLCLGVIFLFYSSGGRDPSGFVGFFTTYFEYETGEGHDKPFGYYFGLLVWPKLAVGTWWTEMGVLLLALCVYLDRRKTTTSWMGRFFVEAGLLHLLAFSLIGYKTPWLVCLGWLQLCLAAGYGVVALARRLPERAVLVPVLGLLCVMAWHGVQALRATGRFAADGRNPYAYVPTSKDVIGLAEWVNEVRAGSKEAPMAVVGDQYWPLPWYLREAGEVGYWGNLPEGSEGVPILFLMPAFFEEGAARLEATHTMIPKGLREEMPIVVAVRNDIWEAYQK